MMKTAKSLPSFELNQHTWRQMKAHLHWIYEAKSLEHNLQFDLYKPDYSAYFLFHGEMRIRTEHQEVFARSGQWVFVGPGRREQQISFGAHLRSIHFHLTWPGRLGLDDVVVVDGADFSSLQRGTTNLLRVVQRHFPGVVTGLRRQESSFDAHLSIQEAFLGWLRSYLTVRQSIGALPAPVQMDERIQQVLHRLDQEAYSQPEKDQELARRVGLSVSQLDRLFQKQLGCTPRQYQDRRRLEDARTRIQYTAASFKEIAFSLGFCSSSHFSRWIQARAGVSPTQLRREVHEAA